MELISRQEVLKLFATHDGKYLYEAIRDMPSVKQEPKIGHWIEHDWEGLREKGYFRCSVCNCGYQRYTKVIRKSDIPYIDGKEDKLWNRDYYCPNCGARMVEPQESEE